jgi:hypothetical protein
MHNFEGDLCYPFSQAHRNGFIYTKEQTLKLPFKYPEEHRLKYNDQEEIALHFTGSPLFAAPFPIVNLYLDLSKVTMKNPDADVYFSDSIVTPYIHRLVNLNLDKLLILIRIILCQCIKIL